MIQLLILRDKLSDIYLRYDYWFRPLIKLAASYLVFFMINRSLGYYALLKNPALIFAFALLCSFLPWSTQTILGALMVLGHLSQVSMEMTVIAGVLFLLMALLMSAFKPGHSELILYQAVLYMLGIPYLLPVLTGLSFGLSAVLPTVFGVFCYFMLFYFKTNFSSITADAKGDSVVELANRYVDLLNGLLRNRYMLFVMAAFALSIVVVYLLRNLNLQYARAAAVIAGHLASLITITLAGFAYRITVPVAAILSGELLCVLFCLLYEFFTYGADYSATEYLQFEDDDYYYYVKAIPKLKISKTEVRYHDLTEE